MVEMEQKTWTIAEGKAIQLGQSVLFVERASDGRARLRIYKPVEMRLHKKNFRKYLQNVSELITEPVE